MKEKNERGKTLLWTVRFCFHLSRTYFILWSFLSIAVAVLPAVVLYFQKESISILSDYILTGQGTVSDVLPAVIGLGIFLAAMGVASRFNYGYIWLVLYNKYFLGTEERVMETIRDISRKTFLDQKFKEDYYFAIARCGAVTEIISTLFLLFSKALSILSVSLVVLRYSWQLVLVTFLYILLVVLVNFRLGNKVKDRTADIKLADQRSGYFMDMVMNTGVAKEIRLFDASSRIVEKWEREYNQVKDFERGNDKIYAWLSLVSKLVYFLFISAVLGFAVRQVLAGRMELGMRIAVKARSAEQNYLSDLLCQRYGIQKVEMIHQESLHAFLAGQVDFVLVRGEILPPVLERECETTGISYLGKDEDSVLPVLVVNRDDYKMGDLVRRIIDPQRVKEVEDQVLNGEREEFFY